MNNIIKSIEVTPFKGILPTCSIFKVLRISYEQLKEMLDAFKNKSNKGHLIPTQVLKDCFAVCGSFFINLLILEK